tara:strand:+ start:9140 stop:9259 length:120 start_codon:yes stop_codon:yes gene_type:complete
MEFINKVLGFIMPNKAEPEFSKPDGYKNVNASAVNKAKQ